MIIRAIKYLGWNRRAIRYSTRIVTTLVLLLGGDVAHAQAGAPSLTITSPVAGAKVQPGQSFNVSVSASSEANLASVQLVTEGVGVSTPLTSAPYSFTLSLPCLTAGPENITALGVTPDETVFFSPAVAVDCEPSVAVSTLSVSLSEINFGFTGDEVGLSVQGTLSDGSSVDLTQSSNTSFLSGNIAVATVNSTGLVTAIGPGTTTITVSNGGQIAAATVSVPNSLRGDLNADGKIDADDVNILLSALNTKATGSFDARDLNGDGVIDLKDLQILASLCTLAGCSTSANVPSSPNIVLSPFAVSFGSQLVSTSSRAQMVTVINSGAAALSITSIGTSGDFSETNTCSTSLAPQASCAIDIVFSPTAAGLRSSLLSIADNASGSPQVVGLSGNGTVLAVPSVMVTPSASSVTTAQALMVTVSVSGGVGNPTPTGSVILTGDGFTSSAATLSSGSATINIPAGSLAVGSDTLTATYTPDNSSSSTYSSGAGSAPVSVSQAVPPSFALTNSGGITVARGASTENTSVVTITPASGFTGTVNLSCSVSPVTAVPPTCAVPASVTVTGSTSVTATLTINTSASSNNATLLAPDRANFLRAGVLAFTLLCFLGIPARRRHGRFLFGLLFILALGVAIGCGGASSGSGGGGGGGGATGTTMGAYTVTVTGTSGSLTSSTSVSLTVN